MKVTHIKAGKIVPSWIFKIQTKGKKHLAHRIKSGGFFVVRHDGALYCYPEVDHQTLIHASNINGNDMQPGIYDNIPNADYHGGQGISKSGLDLIAKSPAHFAAAKLEPREPTKAQALGTAIHALILEPDVFAAEYAPEIDKANYPNAFFSKQDLIDCCDENSIHYKKSDTIQTLREYLDNAGVEYEMWDSIQIAYIAHHKGKTILDTTTWQQLHNMRDAVMAHPMARKVLTKAGKAEQSIYWIDEETGEACRCRPDYLTDCGIAVDLKSTADASPEGFIKSIANFRYHVQAAMYEDGIRAVDHPFAVVAFTAVEKDACVINGKSKGVAVYTLDEASLIEGRLEYQANLKTYSECKKADVWPGYSESHTELTLPRWAMKNINSGG